MSWCTGVQATTIVGETITDQQCNTAQPIIELFADTTQDADADQSDRTLRLLKYAVAYQAKWMIPQVDVLSRTDVTQVSQDGVQVVPSDDDALLLAPLARRALNRLPWRKSRSVFTGTLPVGYPNQIALMHTNILYEHDDNDAHPWHPLSV